MSRVELQQIVQSYAGHPVLQGLDLDVQSGEYVVLLGPSGCGKTTAAKVILGFEKPTSGDIVHKGRRAEESRNEKVWFTEGIQAIFQDPFASLNPRLSVGQIVGEALETKAVEQYREWIREARALVSELGATPIDLARARAEGGDLLVTTPRHALAVEAGAGGAMGSSPAASRARAAARSRAMAPEPLLAISCASSWNTSALMTRTHPSSP